MFTYEDALAITTATMNVARAVRIPAATVTAEQVAEARAHLGAALMQTIPSDDQIIMDHMRDAYRLLGGR